MGLPDVIKVRRRYMPAVPLMMKPLEDCPLPHCRWVWDIHIQYGGEEMLYLHLSTSTQATEEQIEATRVWAKLRFPNHRVKRITVYLVEELG